MFQFIMTDVENTRFIHVSVKAYLRFLFLYIQRIYSTKPLHDGRCMVCNQDKENSKVVSTMSRLFNSPELFNWCLFEGWCLLKFHQKILAAEELNVHMDIQYSSNFEENSSNLSE